MGTVTQDPKPALVSATVQRKGSRAHDSELLLEQLLPDVIGNGLHPVEDDYDYEGDIPAGPAAEQDHLARMSPGRPAGDVWLEEFGQRLVHARAMGWDIDDPVTREYLLDHGPIGGGMPTGVTGLAFVHNLPPAGTYVESTDTFFRTTERNDIPQPPVAYPGLGGGPVDLRIPNIGVLGTIRAVFQLSLVVAGAGTSTSLYNWPWQAGGKRVSLNINGQTSIISCEGVDLRARRQRYYRTPREQVSSVQGNNGVDQSTGNPIPAVIANGTYTVTLVYDLPIPHDDYNLAGVVYAQSDQNALAWRIEPPAQPVGNGSGDMFTEASGSTVALTGTVYWTATIYDVPFGDTSDGRKVLLPDMSWIHGLLGFNQPIIGNLETQVALIRTAGQLLCTYVYLDNGGLAQIDPAALTEIRMQYGGNRRPRVYNPPQVLLEKNGHDYNGRILSTSVAGAGGYFLLDNEVDNPIRDLVVPKGVTELYVVVNVPNSITINANAHGHVVEETMFKGR